MLWVDSCRFKEDKKVDLEGSDKVVFPDPELPDKRVDAELPDKRVDVEVPEVPGELRVWEKRLGADGGSNTNINLMIFCK